MDEPVWMVKKVGAIIVVIMNNGHLFKLRISQYARYLVWGIKVPVPNTGLIIRCHRSALYIETTNHGDRSYLCDLKPELPLNAIFRGHERPNDPSLVPLFEIPEFSSEH